MSTTIFTVALFSVLLIGYFSLNAFFLQLGSRWAKIGKVTYKRALCAIAATEAARWIIFPFADWMLNAGIVRPLFVGIFLFVFTLAVIWRIISLILRTTFWRAAWAWIPTVASGIGYVLLVMATVKPFLIEAFVLTSNSMAPALLGRHWEAPCPRCGSPAYSSVEPDVFGYRSHNRPVLMICGREYRSCEVTGPPGKILPGDKLLVNKLITPRRWDIIVFRYPEDPAINYCMRLVGLPGETVAIRDGAVWINGEKMSPPESCAGLEYLDKIEGYPEQLWGSPAKPARLGPDEYFVLGDFSARAKDSRFWQQGAPGHPPYAVPENCLAGVATHIYWPLQRCKILR